MDSMKWKSVVAGRGPFSTIDELLLFNSDESPMNDVA